MEIIFNIQEFDFYPITCGCITVVLILSFGYSALGSWLHKISWRFIHGFMKHFLKVAHFYIDI